ncbi:MAG: YHS domain-containing (seleno)protein [Usitatibacter sp.]
MALKGYDTVAYFTDNKPVKGAPEYRQDFDGLRYHFSSARNRSTFSADPDHFAPQFAANCAVSVSKGRRVEADPNVWKIVDGKLFVFASPKALEMAEKDPTILQRAQQDWAASK